MKYNNELNLLLESLSYFGRKTSNRTWQDIEDKIKTKKLNTSTSFNYTFTKLKKLTQILDKKINIPDEILNKFFINLSGLSFNTIGSNSIAFLIFHEVIDSYNDDFQMLIAEMNSFSRERIAYNITTALGIYDNNSSHSLNDCDFIDSILALSIPPESKITILEVFRNYNEYLDVISIYLKSVINILKQEIDLCTELTTSLNVEVSKISCLEFINKTTNMKLIDGCNYSVKPFLFGMDTLLVSSQTKDSANIYCGILRKELLAMINNNLSCEDNLYEGYHLLGDKTRFDILCYLRTNVAYGQELSNHLNLSRNTIHHHMSKLINYGFVSCTTDGNRVYYSLNKKAFDSFIRNEKEVFLEHNE